MSRDKEQAEDMLGDEMMKGTKEATVEYSKATRGQRKAGSAEKSKEFLLNEEKTKTWNVWEGKYQYNHTNKRRF